MSVCVFDENSATEEVKSKVVEGSHTLQRSRVKTTPNY
jgi:hypothetical protein